MAIEIERKFLLASGVWRTSARVSTRMLQAYLAGSGEAPGRCSVRVRIAGDAANLNIKSRELGAMRSEFEYPIPLADAESLMALAQGAVVDKTRHCLRHGGHRWEIDEFHGDNAGLLVAEIELDAVDAPFDRPDWLGREVTDLPRYYNLALSMRPFSRWSEEEKSC